MDNKRLNLNYGQLVINVLRYSKKIIENDYCFQLAKVKVAHCVDISWCQCLLVLILVLICRVLLMVVKKRVLNGRVRTKKHSCSSNVEASRQDQAGIPPKPLRHVTIIHYAWRQGPNVTNQICWTCKNCSHKCAADCEHCVTQSSTKQFW